MYYMRHLDLDCKGIVTVGFVFPEVTCSYKELVVNAVYSGDKG
jgi:hypothetical protein